MTDTPFHMTQLGRRYYEATLPELVRRISRLADALERLAEKKGDQRAPGRRGRSTRRRGRDAMTAYTAGQRVVIRFNPHRSHAKDLVGAVGAVRLGSELTAQQRILGFCWVALARRQACLRPAKRVNGSGFLPGM